MAHDIDISEIHKRASICSSYDEYMLTREEVTEMYKLLLYISWNKIDTQEHYEMIHKLVLSQYKPPNETEIFEIVDYLKDEGILGDEGTIHNEIEKLK